MRMGEPRGMHEIGVRSTMTQVSVVDQWKHEA